MVEQSNKIISGQGSLALTNLQNSLKELDGAFARYFDRPEAALHSASGFRSVVDAIDQMGNLSAKGGVDVPQEDAAKTGLMMYVDPESRITPSTLSEACNTHVAAGRPAVVAGAGAPLVDLVTEIPSWRQYVGSDGLVAQYVGIDPSHWEPEHAEPALEVNLLQTAALLALNSAMNKVKRPAVLIAHGFGCWVVNRALHLLPRDQVWFARTMQLEAVGSKAAMEAFISAKKNGLGAICSVQSRPTAEALQKQFGVPKASIANLPVDLRSQ